MVYFAKSPRLLKLQFIYVLKVFTKGIICKRKWEVNMNHCDVLNKDQHFFFTYELKLL